jgi:hypothetical protein
MGLTNKVQPYCRLAIITMQMMPAISCIQRIEAGLLAAGALAYAISDSSL